MPPLAGVFQRLLGRARRAGEAVEAAVERHPRPIAASALALALAAGLVGAVRKEMWFDEIATYSLTGLGRVGAVQSALDAGADGNQVGFYLFTLASSKAFGLGPASIRFPALIGFLAFAASLGLFAARRCGVLAGWVAALAPFLLGSRLYLVEGRTYGLILGFSGVILLFWQGLEGNNRRLAGAGLALSGMAGLLTSPLVALSVLAVAVGEAWRSAVLKRIRWPAWLALAACGATFVGARLASRHGFERLAGAYEPFIGLPVVPSLVETYGRLLNLWPMVYKVSVLVALGSLVISAMAWLDPAPGRGSGRRERGGLLPWETAAAIALLATPVSFMLASRLFHQPFIPRYSLAATAGLAILAASGFEKVRADGWGGLFGAFLLAAAASALALQVTKQGTLTNDPQDQTGHRALVGSREGPVVVSNAFYFMRDTWYVKGDLKDRLYFLYEPDPSRRYHEPAGDVAAILPLRPYWRMNTMPYRDFVGKNRGFLVINPPGERRWLVRRLAADGFLVTRVAVAGDAELLRVERREGKGAGPRR